MHVQFFLEIPHCFPKTRSRWEFFQSTNWLTHMIWSDFWKLPIWCILYPWLTWAAVIHYHTLGSSLVRPLKVADFFPFCTSPIGVPVSPTSYSHDWPSYILVSSLVSDCSNFRSRCSILLIKGAMRGGAFCWFPW